MNKALFLSVILLGSAAFAQNKEAAASAEPVPNHCSVASDDQAVRQIAQDFKNGYNAGDAAKVAALYIEDATYMTQHYVTGFVQGRARIQAYVQKGVDAKYKIESIEVLSSGCSRDMAYAIARYQAINNGEKAFGVNLLVLRKIKGKWMIVAHEAAVPDPANAVKTLDVPRGN